MHINKKQYRKGHFGCLGGQGREEADREPTVPRTEGAPTLSSLHPRQGVKLTARHLQHWGLAYRLGTRGRAQGCSPDVFSTFWRNRRGIWDLYKVLSFHRKERKGTFNFLIGCPTQIIKGGEKRSEWVRAELLSRNKGCAFGINGPCTIGPEHSGVQEGKKWKLPDAVKKMGVGGVQYSERD